MYTKKSFISVRFSYHKLTFLTIYNTGLQLVFADVQKIYCENLQQFCYKIYQLLLYIII